MRNLQVVILKLNTFWRHCGELPAPFLYILLLLHGPAYRPECLYTPNVCLKDGHEKPKRVRLVGITTLISELIIFSTEKLEEAQ